MLPREFELISEYQGFPGSEREREGERKRGREGGSEKERERGGERKREMERERGRASEGISGMCLCEQKEREEQTKADLAASTMQQPGAPGDVMFQLMPGSIEPPMVNICPPSPQNNVDPKTGNFSL